MGNLFLLLGLLAGGPEPGLIRGKAVPVVRFEEAPQVRVTRSGTRIANGIFTGQSKFADGSAAAPSISFTSDPDTGLYRVNSNYLGMTLGGVVQTAYQAGYTTFKSTMQFGWSSGDPTADGMDLILTRDAANTLAQRNGTSAQAFNIYNTFTSATSYERAELLWSSNTFYIATRKGAGGGVARALGFGTDGSVRWEIGTTGDLTASGAHQISTTGNIVGAEGVFSGNVNSSGVFRDGDLGTRLDLGTGDGVATLANNAQTNVFTVATADWGTKLTPETISYTVGSITPIVTAGAVGKLLIVNVDDGALCEFALRGGAAPVEMSDVAPQCSVVLGTGSSINVYWDAGDARYEMQMNLAATKQLRLMVFGG
jgi:hypothetical protein